MLFNMEQEMSRSGEDCLLQLAAVARATEEMFDGTFGHCFDAQENTWP
jgi:hypothetical protein